MSKDGNGGVKVREFAVVVPLNLHSPGRVEDEINKFSQTLTPKIPSLFMRAKVISEVRRWIGRSLFLRFVNNILRFEIGKHSTNLLLTSRVLFSECFCQNNWKRLRCPKMWYLYFLLDTLDSLTWLFAVQTCQQRQWLGWMIPRHNGKGKLTQPIM